ncbi:hypothetical protein [Peterkaempfera bronchialis]|uniref:Uncharacterized protein n=1 Tax=Peterkaempfera bronchialis TaxID=2126346 RepID=A0A345SXY7_9ACTN|nr:hypothetical protein [Peterkaempfera bronchialis]AXI78592.1 hypothetical protein C7M71_015285 [Peterkaempfera bronchialis]
MLLAVGESGQEVQAETRRLLFEHAPSGLGLDYRAMTSKLQSSGHLEYVLSAITQLAGHLDQE